MDFESGGAAAGRRRPRQPADWHGRRAVRQRQASACWRTTRANRCRQLPDALARAAQGRQTFTTAPLPDGTEWRVMTTPVTENGVQIGILQVGRPVAEVDCDAAPAGAAAGAGRAVHARWSPARVACSWPARALDPIDRITRAAAAIGADDLSRRLNFRGSRDEVGRLAATFDRMLDRLERRISTAAPIHRRRVARAAHAADHAGQPDRRGARAGANAS